MIVGEMKLAVIEAMRLRNEISEEVGKLSYTRGGVSYGTSIEDDVRVDDKSMPTILEHMQRAKQLLIMSLEVNNVLDEFNKTNCIGQMVRQIKNNELLLSMYNSSLNNAVSREVSRREKLDNKHVTVITKFEPYLNKSVIRKTQKELRAENRDIQSKIDKFNAQTINLSFSHEDFEELTVSASGY